MGDAVGLACCRIAVDLAGVVADEVQRLRIPIDELNQAAESLAAVLGRRRLGAERVDGQPPVRDEERRVPFGVAVVDRDPVRVDQLPELYASAQVRVGCLPNGR
jgi:hypothetical protein